MSIRSGLEAAGFNGLQLLGTLTEFKPEALRVVVHTELANEIAVSPRTQNNHFVTIHSGTCKVPNPGLAGKVPQIERKPRT
jgi:hypothetical protein